MVMTGPLILAADVEVVAVAKLPARLRARLGARRGEYAVTRPRGRAPAKLVSGSGASLLAEFRTACAVVDAVRRVAGPDGDAARLLDDAFPLLRDCFNSKFLVSAGSPEAARIIASRDRGDAIGPYEVLRCLRVVEDVELYQARGGDGGVAAVKLVRRHAPGDVAASLTREAAVLEMLGGAQAPRLIARGRHRHRPWLAMTWCDGVAPEVAFGELRERGPAARADLLRLAVRIARAYAALHRAGVLHGDVHPGNLLIGRQGDVTLLDFALARPLRSARLPGRAGTGGVAAYFAPEQAAAVLAGRTLPAPTIGSEQYALAAMLYGLLAGAPPVSPAPDRDGLLREIAGSPPRPFSRAGTAPWPAVEAALLRSLAKDPRGRFAGVAQLAAALGRAGAGRGPAGARRGEPPAPERGARATALAGMVDQFVAAAESAAGDGGSPGLAPTCSVMLGRAGTAYALLRIACARNDPEVLALADVWLARVERDAGTTSAFEAPDQGLTLRELGAASPFHGSPGPCLVRALLATTMGDESAAAAAAQGFAEASLAPATGLDLTMGRAGTLLATTHLIALVPRRRPRLRTALCRLGDSALDEVWRAVAGYGPAGRAAELDSAGTAHGWAGILHATLAWCAATGRSTPRPLRRRLAELAAAAEPLGRGVRWAQHDPVGAPEVWAAHEVAGWCNGPAGFTCLWLAAHARWRQPAHLALAEACAWSAWEARATSPDLCCGRVGRAYALLSLYRHTGCADWLERARSLAAAARITFDRTRDTLERPLSLFKGEAGLAVLAADLEHPETAAFPFFEPDFQAADPDA